MLIFIAVSHTLLFGGIVLFLIPYFVKGLDIYLPIFSIGVLRYLAIIPFMLGSLISLWCILLFLTEGRGTPAIYASPKRLVISGPYKYVRNPMQIGVLLMLYSESIFFESPALLLYALIISFGFHLLVVLYEEKKLEQSFGESYESYRKYTNRWLPRCSKKDVTEK